MTRQTRNLGQFKGIWGANRKGTKGGTSQTWSSRLVKKSIAQLRCGPIDDQLGHSILPNSVSWQENGPENKKTCQQSSKVVKLEGLMGEY